MVLLRFGTCSKFRFSVGRASPCSSTVDQQRELMRYMRGLNEWLERDVYDRQSKLRGVVARVEQLSHDIRGIRAQGKDSSISIF